MEERKRIFNFVQDYLADNLPVDLRYFKKSGDHSNLLRLRYVDLPRCMYELHFAERSYSHAEYFDTGHLDLLALYFGKYLKLNTRLVWIAEMESQKETISRDLDMEIKIGFWGPKPNRWTWVATCLQKEPKHRDERHYAATFAKFIEATHKPVKRAILMALSS